ncbi:MAG TPA: nucleotidyltransferase family protein, partial [Thermoleophilia bacterium]|nr:nucleotidyltransferase family protein [Thermoleophilia bacterium]
MTTPADTPPIDTTPADEPPIDTTPPKDVTPPLAAVLLACTRDPGDARTAAALRAALARVASAPPGDPGWDALADAALRHGMSGLLYRRVVDLAYETVPQAVLLGWRQRVVAAGQRSLRMQRELLQVLDGLEAAGLPALAFKGPALSQQLYGDAGLRHFIDLDVLVQPHQLATAREVLLGCGYRDTLPLDKVSLTLLQEAEHHMAFTHTETGASVEVHWRVGPRFAADSLPADALFARAVPVELLGRKVASLGPLDLVVMLTVHEAKHSWDRVEGVAAVASALRRLSSEEAR